MARKAAKKTARFKNPPTGVAVSVGRALGRLMAQRDRLMQQLSGVEQKIADARAEAEAGDSPVPPALRKAKTIVGRAASESSRRTMETAAKKRWLAVKRPNSKGMGR